MVVAVGGVAGGGGGGAYLIIAALPSGNETLARTLSPPFAMGTLMPTKQKGRIEPRNEMRGG